MRKTDWLVVAVLALCAVGLVACGGGSDAGNGGGGVAGEEEAGLAFAECMRGRGVAIEDPKPGHGIALPDDSPKTKGALAACDGKLGDSGQELSAGEDEELREGALAFAHCMREEGIEMGDPTFPGPGKFLLDIKGLDTESPAFVAAQESCGEKLPQLKGLGIGG